MCYTLEHVTRRKELMPLKGKVKLDKVSEILNITSAIMGPDQTQYYLIAGLDPVSDVIKWVESHQKVAIPQIHVFTPYAPGHYNLIPIIFSLLF